MDNMLLKANPSLPIHPSHAYMLIAPNLNKLSGLRKGSVNKYVQAPCCSGLKNRSSGSICVTCLTSVLPVQTLMALMQDADSPIAEDVEDGPADDRSQEVSEPEWSEGELLEAEENEDPVHFQQY